MQSKLWSISGLATELGMDRRTLAKRLESLAPAEEKKTGKRIQKLWRMSDVVEHLRSPRPQQAELDAENKKLTKEYLSTQLFPLIVSNAAFVGTIFSGAKDDGLTRQQALNQYKTAFYAIVSALSDITGDEDFQVETGKFYEFLQEKGDKEIIKNWPE